MKSMTQIELAKAIVAGRKFCRATLQERQDFQTVHGPLREVTHEPEQWFRVKMKKELAEKFLRKNGREA